LNRGEGGVCSPIERGSHMPMANVNNINIHYRVYGDGEPLILICGLGAELGSWFLQLRPFKKHYRVVVFDNRGIGRSDKPLQPYTTKDMAADMVGLMDHLGIEQANVLGASMGGMIAQEVALNYPDRVKKLVLASTGAGGWDPETSPEVRCDMRLEEGTRVDWSVNNLVRLMIAMARYSCNSRAHRFLLIALVRIFTKPSMSEGMAGQLPALAGHSTIDRLHLIKSPTIVIGGTKDWIFSRGAMELLAQRIPGARLVLVEGANHAMMTEMHGRFNREVLAFLGAK
jgi:3-oxoadipate enol-lactonase